MGTRCREGKAIGGDEWEVERDPREHEDYVAGDKAGAGLFNVA